MINWNREILFLPTIPQMPFLLTMTIPTKWWRIDILSWSAHLTHTLTKLTSVISTRDFNPLVCSIFLGGYPPQKVTQRVKWDTTPKLSIISILAYLKIMLSKKDFPFSRKLFSSSMFNFGGVICFFFWDLNQPQRPLEASWINSTRHLSGVAALTATKPLWSNLSILRHGGLHLASPGFTLRESFSYFRSTWIPTPKE